MVKSKQHHRLFATVHLRVENLFLHVIAQASVNMLDTKNLFIEQSQANLNETQNVTSWNRMLVSLDMIGKFYSTFHLDMNCSAT